MTAQRYIGVAVPKAVISVTVIKYDPVRVALIDSCDRAELLQAIAAHLRRALKDGGTLYSAYRLSSQQS